MNCDLVPLMSSSLTDGHEDNIKFKSKYQEDNVQGDLVRLVSTSITDGNEGERSCMSVDQAEDLKSDLVPLVSTSKTLGQKDDNSCESIVCQEENIKHSHYNHPSTADYLKWFIAIAFCSMVLAGSFMWSKMPQSAKNTREDESVVLPPCVLFPPALNAIRMKEQDAYAAQIVPPNITHDIHSDINNSTSSLIKDVREDDPKDACSCTNLTASPTCCSRRLMVMHKMGVALSHDESNELGIRDAIENETIKRTTPHQKNKIQDFYSESNDYRDVFLFRNIYQALVSGYLYHKTGHECWLTSNSVPIKNVNKGKLFEQYMSFQLPPFNESLLLYTDKKSGETKTYRLTMCRYLSVVSEYDGLHAYIEYVFKKFYRDHLERYASSTIMPLTLGTRTNVVCYMDLVKGNIKERRDIAQREILGFLLNNESVTGTPFKERQSKNCIRWNKKGSLKRDFQKAEMQEYGGGHATSHEPTLRDHLFDVIQQVDADFYNNSISWLASSFWPC